MSDDRLRAAERRYRETQSLEDEAAWLTLRLRSGALPLAVLELAAYADHPAACAVLAQEAPYPRATALNRDLIALADGRQGGLQAQLAAWPRRVQVGFVLAALQRHVSWSPRSPLGNRWRAIWQAVSQEDAAALAGACEPLQQDARPLLVLTLHVAQALAGDDSEELARRLRRVVEGIAREGTVQIRRAVLRWARHLLHDPASSELPYRVR